MNTIIKIIAVCLAITSLTARNLIINGSFEADLKHWNLRGQRGFISNAQSLTGHASFYVDTAPDDFQKGHIHQWLAQPVHTFKVQFSVLPASDSIYNTFELISHWDSAGAASFIAEIRLRSNLIELRSFDRTLTVNTALRPYEWNTISLETGPDGYEKHLAVNGIYQGSLTSPAVLPVEMVFIGDVSPYAQFGRVYYDNIIITDYRENRLKDIALQRATQFSIAPPQNSNPTRPARLELAYAGNVHTLITDIYGNTVHEYDMGWQPAGTVEYTVPNNVHLGKGYYIVRLSGPAATVAYKYIVP